MRFAKASNEGYWIDFARCDMSVLPAPSIYRYDIYIYMFIYIYIYSLFYLALYPEAPNPNFPQPMGPELRGLLEIPPRPQTLSDYKTARERFRV